MNTIMFRVSINKDALELIQESKKIYEIRLKRGLFTKISKGDSINFINNNLSTVKIVDNILEFDSIDEMYSYLDYRQCAPLSLNLEEAKQRLYKFYSKSKLKNYNVIAIKLK